MATNNNNIDPNILQQLCMMYQQGQISLNPNMNMNQGNMNMNQGNMNMNMNQGNMNMNQGNMNMNQFGNNPGTVFIPPNQSVGFNNNNFGGMNQMNFFPNTGVNINQVNQNQAEDWLLIFETKPNNSKINIQISSADTVANAFSKYRLKVMENDTALKFTYKGKPLDPKLTLSASGLTNNSLITVEKINISNPLPKPKPIIPDKNIMNLFFEKRGDEHVVNIQVEPDKYVKDAIAAYRNKVVKEGNMIFIYNSKTLDENMSLKQAGITTGARIIVIETEEIVGAY